MSEPTTIYAGATAKWTRSVSNDYSAASGYALEYILISADDKITISGGVITGSASDYTILIPASTTSDYIAGTYQWTLYAVHSGDSLRYRVMGGDMVVAPNVVDATTLDGRTHVKVVLDAIEALIEGRIPDGLEGLSVRGRSLQLMAISELVELRSVYRQYYRTEQDAERVNQGLTSRRKIRVKFT